MYLITEERGWFCIFMAFPDLFAYVATEIITSNGLCPCFVSDVRLEMETIWEAGVKSP